MFKRGRFTVSIKFLILIAGVICAIAAVSQAKPDLSVPLSIICAGCVIAFALIENNDVREANKE